MKYVKTSRKQSAIMQTVKLITKIVEFFSDVSSSDLTPNIIVRVACLFLML